jgi:hypothetical protein
MKQFSVYPVDSDKAKAHGTGVPFYTRDAFLNTQFIAKFSIGINKKLGWGVFGVCKSANITQFF